jgi:SAM-dependent methyltransferase
MELLNRKNLLSSGVVANNRMNRERRLAGSNSYRKDLFFDATDFLRKRLTNSEPAAWLDIGCGSGRALIEAARVLEDFSGNWQITGIDLAGMFYEYPAALSNLKLIETAVEDFDPPRQFDLITSVHGLHYIGDKLAIIRKAARWLKADGFFAANLELQNLKLAGKRNSARAFSAFLRKAGFTVDSRKHLISLPGKRDFDLPFTYLGADDKTGPNYTGQPVVDSYYEL